MKKRDFITFLALSLILVIALVSGDEPICAGALSAYSLAPLMRVPGSVSMPGFKNRIAIIPAHYVLSAPQPEYDEFGVLKSVELDGEFIFEDGYNFKYIDCGNKSVGHTSESQGESGSKSFKQKGEFSHPGVSKPAALAFATEIINCECIIVMETKDNRQIVIGFPGDGVEPTCTSDLGKAATDGKSLAFTYEFDASAPVFYLKTPIDFDALKTQSDK